MVVLLVMVAVAAAAAGLWARHRHQELVVWERELDDAFRPRDLRELPRHRSL